jgi:hypothetical protein
VNLSSRNQYIITTLKNQQKNYLFSERRGGGYATGTNPIVKMSDITLP